MEGCALHPLGGETEARMALVYGDVIQNSGTEMPFRVVFRHHNGTVLSEWDVPSKEDGERQLIDSLRALGELPAGSA